MSELKIREVGMDFLPQYSAIPIAFEVRSIFQVEAIQGGLGGLLLKEILLPQPYVKDYDHGENEGPLGWPGEFDMRKWGFLAAHLDEKLVGGAAIAFDTSGVNMLEGRKDMAVLWDIRVHPQFRCQGIGTHIFQEAATWARKRGCKLMKIETQNVNIAACKFYARMGCELGGINRYGYAGIPHVAHESMLLWYYHLRP